MDIYIKLFSEPGLFTLNLGFTLRNQGQIAVALAAYQTAISPKYEYAKAHYNLEAIYCKQEKLKSKYIIIMRLLERLQSLTGTYPSLIFF